MQKIQKKIWPVQLLENAPYLDYNTWGRPEDGGYSCPGKSKYCRWDPDNTKHEDKGCGIKGACSVGKDGNCKRKRAFEVGGDKKRQNVWYCGWDGKQCKDVWEPWLQSAGCSETPSEELCVQVQEDFVTKWTFRDGSCQTFSYGGCGGGSNVFDSEEECKVACH